MASSPLSAHIRATRRRRLKPVAPTRRSGQVPGRALRLGSRAGPATGGWLRWRPSVSSGMLGFDDLCSSARSGVVPCVVEVDRLGGKSRDPVIPALGGVSAVGRTDRALPGAIYRERSLVVDRPCHRPGELAARRAYDFVTDRGAQALATIMREKLIPSRRSGSKTVTAEVMSVVRASGDSFEIR